MSSGRILDVRSTRKDHILTAERNIMLTLWDSTIATDCRVASGRCRIWPRCWWNEILTFKSQLSGIVGSTSGSVVKPPGNEEFTPNGVAL